MLFQSRQSLRTISHLVKQFIFVQFSWWWPPVCWCWGEDEDWCECEFLRCWYLQPPLPHSTASLSQALPVWAVENGSPSEPPTYPGTREVWRVITPAGAPQSSLNTCISWAGVVNLYMTLLQIFQSTKVGKNYNNYVYSFRFKKNRLWIITLNSTGCPKNRDLCVQCSFYFLWLFDF